MFLNLFIFLALCTLSFLFALSIRYFLNINKLDHDTTTYFKNFNDEPYIIYDPESSEPSRFGVEKKGKIDDVCEVGYGV